jgi:uncharacterized protein YdcH (DUF465 family)
MSELGHDLHALFPAQRDILHTLKIESEHYRGLAARHHELALEIGHIEADLDAASDVRLEELKKQRLAVLDDIAHMIGERQGA